MDQSQVNAQAKTMAEAKVHQLQGELSKLEQELTAVENEVQNIQRETEAQKMASNTFDQANQLTPRQADGV